EAHVGAGGVCLAHRLQVGDRLAATVLLEVLLAVAHDPDLELLGKGVHDRQPDPVQPAGNLVAAAAELASGVEQRQHYLQGRLAAVFHDVHRNSASVVGHRGRAVRVQGDLDPVAVPGEGLVDGVVDELVDQVVETPVVGRTDVHPGSPPDGLQTLQNLDGFGVVG